MTVLQQSNWPASTPKGFCWSKVSLPYVLVNAHLLLKKLSLVSNRGAWRLINPKKPKIQSKINAKVQESHQKNFTKGTGIV